MRLFGEKLRAEEFAPPTSRRGRALAALLDHGSGPAPETGNYLTRTLKLGMTQLGGFSGELVRTAAELLPA